MSWEASRKCVDSLFECWKYLILLSFRFLIPFGESRAHDAAVNPMMSISWAFSSTLFATSFGLECSRKVLSDPDEAFDVAYDQLVYLDHGVENISLESFRCSIR